jgi:hypothetical protein
MLSESTRPSTVENLADEAALEQPIQEAFVADHVGGPTTIAAAGAIVAASVLLAQLVPSYRRPGVR